MASARTACSGPSHSDRIRRTDLGFGRPGVRQPGEHPIDAPLHRLPAARRLRGCGRHRRERGDDGGRDCNYRDCCIPSLALDHVCGPPHGNLGSKRFLNG